MVERSKCSRTNHDTWQSRQKQRQSSQIGSNWNREYAHFVEARWMNTQSDSQECVPTPSQLSLLFRLADRGIQTHDHFQRCQPYVVRPVTATDYGRIYCK